MSGQLWIVNSLGGYMYSDRLSDVLRSAVQPLVKFRQFADVKDAAVQGKNKGDIFHWNVYSDITTQGTTLLETTTMPESNFTITQGTMTITEMGNSVPYTGKLDDLSRQPVQDIIQKVLKNDAKKAFDFASYAQFNSTPLIFSPLAGTSTGAVVLTTNSIAATTNNVPLHRDHVKAIVDVMKERNVPPFMGDDYMSIGHPTSFRTLKNDLEDVRKYTDPGYALIVNGEIGRYEGVRFVEQTNIAKENWVNGMSNQVFFFGGDTVSEGIAVPEEMRGKIPGDYGRSKGIAWYYLGGFGLVHTDPKQGRIFKWGTIA